MKAYVVEWHTENLYKSEHGISGVFLSMEDAVSTLWQTQVPCYRRVPGGMWKLGTCEGAAEVGVAYLATVDGAVWEICGPGGMLVDGDGKDEPEYTIREFEVGRIGEMGYEQS